MSDIKAAMVAEEVQGVVSKHFQGAWNRVERLEEELAAALRRAEEAEAIANLAMAEGLRAVEEARSVYEEARIALQFDADDAEIILEAKNERPVRINAADRDAMLEQIIKRASRALDALTTWRRRWS